jgi:hypothetical protein
MWYWYDKQGYAGRLDWAVSGSVVHTGERREWGSVEVGLGGVRDHEIWG